MSNLQVILASASPRRSSLLDLIGVPHLVRPADVEEVRGPGEEPIHYAERLARAKAAAVEASPASVVIAADTIVVLEGDVLEKPRDIADAQVMLARLSGRKHRVVTAVAVRFGGSLVSAVEMVDVWFRHLSDADVAAYVATGEPMDKAGSYGIQGFGATIVARVEGDYFAVMGLPLVRTVELLASVGITYPFGPLSSGAVKRSDSAAAL